MFRRPISRVKNEAGTMPKMSYFEEVDNETMQRLMLPIVKPRV